MFSIFARVSLNCEDHVKLLMSVPGVAHKLGGLAFEDEGKASVE
jgi:hypothetical protein